MKRMRLLTAGLLALAWGWGSPGTARAATLSFPTLSLTAPNGTAQTIPLSASFAADEHVLSLELELDFPSNWIVTGISTTGTLLESWGASHEQVLDGDGLVLAAAAPAEMVGTGVLLNVEVLVSGSGWQDLLSARLNQGSPVPVLTDAYFTHNLPQALTVSPSSVQHLIPGESVQFSASGSPTPPLSWSVDDPASGQVSPTGLFSCLTQGRNQVRVVDSAGRLGASAMLELYTFHLAPGPVSGMAGQTLSLPLTLANPGGAAFHSLSFTLNLGSNRLTVTGLQAGTGLLSGWSNLSFTQQGNLVTVAGTAPGEGSVSGEGLLFTLEVASSLGAAFNSTFGLTELRLDEDWRTRTATASGQWSATNSFTLTPQTATLLAGQTLQLQVVGTPNGALDWSSLDPAVLSVGATGLVTALSGGRTRVMALDPLGVGDTTGFIQVHDLTVAPASQSAPAGSFVLVPLQTGELGGRGVQAWQFRLSYPGAWLTFDGLETTGSLSEGWSDLQWTLTGTTLEAAGAGPVLSGAGSLVLLRFWVDPAAPNNQTASLQLQDFLYNEGLPSVQRGNGTLTFGGSPPACSVSPGSLDFGSLLPGSSAERSFTITNTGGGTLSGTVAESCGEFSVLSGGTYSLGPGQSQNVTLRFQGSIAGSFACVVDAGALCGQDVDLTASVVQVSPVYGPESACGLVEELGHLPGANSGFVVDWLAGQVGLDLNPAPAANLRARIRADGALVYEGAATPAWRGNVYDLSPLLDQDVELHLELWDGVAGWNVDGALCLWELGFVGLGEPGQPLAFRLDPPAPNPFNPATWLSYTLDSPGDMHLRIYNIQGALVRVLDEGVRAAGEHRLRFEAGELPSGVYLAVLESQGRRQSRKLLLAK